MLLHLQVDPATGDTERLGKLARAEQTTAALALAGHEHARPREPPSWLSGSSRGAVGPVGVVGVAS